MSLLALLVAAGCDSSSKDATGSSSTTTSSSVPARPLNTSVAVPTLIGPTSGPPPNIPMNAMLVSYASKYGYKESEYFMQGTATSYDAVGTLGEDGKWKVKAGAQAPYKSRIIVRVPEDPKKFNGTVFVEWLNTTAGRDADPDFGFAGSEMLREGAVYVGVTAQKVGVDGGFAIPIPGYHPKGLKGTNPARYNSLNHPGDQYSYDIFSQAAQAILQPKGANPLGELRPEHLVAVGESQSASRLVTYVNAIAPLTNIYDGFLIHSRGGGGGALSSGPAGEVPTPARIRADVRVPVMMLATETDLFGLHFYEALQPDTDRISTWQMAGTAHADQSTLDYGITSGRQWDRTSKVPDFTKLCGSVNDGPQSYVVRAAVAALNTWVVNGTAPPHAPPISVTDGQAITRDADGNALGGIRMPAVAVPTKTLSGEYEPGQSVICSLFGSQAPFSAAKLKQLYPTHADYVAKVKAAAAAAEKSGFLLPLDADEIVQQAEAAPVPSAS